MGTVKSIALKTLPPSLLKHLRAVDNYFNGDEEIRYLKFLCKPGRTAVDIGANIGVYSYFMQRRATHVYAYEPVPSLVDFLHASFPRGVTVRPVAVSDKPGTARLVIPVAHGRELHELSSIAQDFDDADEKHVVEVPTVRLDDEDVGDVGIVKIEVQQHELAVIAGAVETLRAHQPNLIVAWAPLLYEGTVAEAFADVLELGYRGYFTFNRQLMSLDRYEPSVHANAGNFGQPGQFMNPNLIFSMDRLPAG